MFYQSTVKKKKKEGPNKVCPFSELSPFEPVQAVKFDGSKEIDAAVENVLKLPTLLVGLNSTTLKKDRRNGEKQKI